MIYESHYWGSHEKNVDHSEKKYRNLHRIFHSNFGKEYLKLNSKCSQKIIERIIFSANMVLQHYIQVSVSATKKMEVSK